MDGKTSLAAFALLAAATGGGAVLWAAHDAAPAVPVDPPSKRAAKDRPAARAAALAAEPARLDVAVDPATGNLVRRDNLHAAGSRRPVAVGPVPRGIRCPDGSHLPLLNGVPDAPPLLRSPDRGALPPVVAVVVDRDGWDWYEHADGSMTTSRPHVLVDADGQRLVRVVTVHNAPDAAMAPSAPDSPRPSSSPPPDTESRR